MFTAARKSDCNSGVKRPLLTQCTCWCKKEDYWSRDCRWVCVVCETPPCCRSASAPTLPASHPPAKYCTSVEPFSPNSLSLLNCFCRRSSTNALQCDQNSSLHAFPLSTRVNLSALENQIESGSRVAWHPGSAAAAVLTVIMNHEVVENTSYYKHPPIL